MTIQWTFPDLDQTWVLGMEHGALHYHQGENADADARVRVTHATLVDLLTQTRTVPEVLGDGSLSIEGDPSALVRLMSLLERPEGWFPIVTP